MDGTEMRTLVDEALKVHALEEALEGKKPVEKKLSDDEELRRIVDSLQIRVSIVGCGGGGSNTVNRLSKAGVFGADLIAANSDAKHLLDVHANHKVLLGKNSTRGLGAGAIPEVGEKATLEAKPELEHLIEKSKIVFVTAGMGGGTGTGSAPVVAEISKRSGALTIGIVTMPFKAEGNLRMENAMRGLDRLKPICDTLAVIMNDRLLDLVPKLPLNAAFRVADELLMESIKGLTEVITKPGLVNVDYNDVMTVMKDAGLSLIGMGEGDSSHDRSERMETAVNQALSCPLLGQLEIQSAKGALVRVTGGDDLTVEEAEKAAEMVTAAISPRARMIWGCSVNPELTGKVRVMIVLTGIEDHRLFSSEDDASTGSIESIR